MPYPRTYSIAGKISVCTPPLWELHANAKYYSNANPILNFSPKPNPDPNSYPKSNPNIDPKVKWMNECLTTSQNKNKYAIGCQRNSIYIKSKNKICLFKKFIRL